MFPFGAILSGDPASSFNKARKESQEIQQGDISSQADAIFGKSLQNLYQQMVPGAQPMPGPQGPQAQNMQPAGPGMQPQPQNMQPAAAPPPQQPQAPPQQQRGFAPGEDSYGGSAAGPPRPPAPIPQQGAPQQRPPQSPQAGPAGAPGGQQSQGGDQQQGGQGGGMLTLQQIIPAVQKAVGPNANPKVFAAAVSKYLPLMNAQAQQQWREALTHMRMMNAQTAEERVQQAERRLGIQEQQLAERGRHNLEAEKARKKSLDLREADFHLRQVTADRRWQEAQKRMDAAEQSNNRKAIMDQARIMHLIITENIASVNAGKLPGGIATQDKELQQQMLGRLQMLQESIDRHVKDITSQSGKTPAETVQERFGGFQE